MEKPTIEQDIEHLQRHDQFQRFIELINDLREECIAEMHEVPTDKLQQLSGRILSYDQIMTMASWAETSSSE